METSNTAKQPELTVFVVGEHYIVGAGESIDEIQKNGEWLAAEEIAEVRP